MWSFPDYRRPARGAGSVSWLLVVLLSCNSSARGAPELPRWAEISGKACYDLEGAKQLKLYELSCGECLSAAPLLEAKIIMTSELLDSCADRVAELAKAALGLRTVGAAQAEIIKTQSSQVDEAEAYSIIGGALPWVLAAMAVSFSAGLTLSTAF